MPVRMRGKRVGVEQAKKTDNNKSLLAMPEDASAVGVIRFAGDQVDPSLAVGTKVVFGKGYHQIRLEGMNILVMDEENVYAIVAEDTGADDKQKAS